MSLPCPQLVQELGLLEGSRPLGLTSAHRHKPFLPRGSHMDQELGWELQGASPPLPSWGFVSPAWPGPSQRPWCSGLCLSCPHPLPMPLAPCPPARSPSGTFSVVCLLKWDDEAVEAKMKLEEVESGAQPEERVVPVRSVFHELAARTVERGHSPAPGNQGLGGCEGHSVSESRWPSGASSPQSFGEM